MCKDRKSGSSFITIRPRVMERGGLNEGKYELYNLSSDPNEERNIFENHPDVVKELKKKLFPWIETTTSKECGSLSNAGINPLQQR